jgi:fructose-bisphosphate aldolase, class I
MSTSNINMSTTPFAEELIQNAKLIASAGKGILAADESTGTIGQR